MHIVCLDLEGVLVPEIWIAFAQESGISELRRTTRDEPDYDVLMQQRIKILKEHALGLTEIWQTIAKIEPLDGAKAFLDALRALCQVIILSDTFTQFASPLMQKLGYPTIFCNELSVAQNGEITGYKLRQQNGKFHAVQALKKIGFDVIASGDSFNDLAMIREADAGFLFRAPQKILDDNADVAAFTEYDDLLSAIKKKLSAQNN
ncbi:MAG: bifunctional phosphoserine phosphatase/homoserine phosphotransferase ThrH [Treponemataceae bacterium]|nr:MAG: bifunctional phosphoserine phosphatase/homoserine phosphotransferase ThrH [Treponemataceae bacterium]